MAKAKLNTEVVERKVTSSDEIKVLVWDIITTKEWVNTQIEMIVDDKVYMYQWECNPSNPIRIVFPMSTVLNNIKEWQWSCKNTYIEISKQEAIFPWDPIFWEALEKLRNEYETWLYCLQEANSLRPVFIMKVWDTCLISEDSTLKRTLERRNFVTYDIAKYDNVYNKVIEWDYSSYKINIQSDKKVFYTKSEVEKYYNTPSFDCIRWVD